MIIIVHENSRTVVQVFRDDLELPIESTKLVNEFWRLAILFPEELIAWSEKKYIRELHKEQWKKVFHHDLIMASFAIETSFLPDSIGYVDQMPFINVQRGVLYGTWMMSSDIGGIKGKVLLRFKSLQNEDLNNFNFLLNSIAKIGQQNGLFCYSAPSLAKTISAKPIPTATQDQLFEFVFRHYKSVWALILLWCLQKYDKEKPLFSYLKTFNKRKFFREKVDLSDLIDRSKKTTDTLNSIDVIIPTMGRPKHLLQVLEDLNNQTYSPSKVVVVEQNPQPDSTTELPELLQKKWNFEIIHHFIHRTGACNARNLALNDVRSQWVFFADDDIRIEPSLFEKAFKEIYIYGLSTLNMNCKQEGQETVFLKMKQWGSFGSGTSIVKSSFAKACKFSLIYEHGYGEDLDYGMQLRNKGCDIIYHPEVKILHLKAPIGGFRQKPNLEWEVVQPLPKPSPTLMAFAKKYYTTEQMKGFKISLFLRYYSQQRIRNPFTYLQEMRKRWEKSEELAIRIVNSTERITTV